MTAAMGQKVQILDSEMKIDATIYKVVGLDRSIVVLDIVCIPCNGSGVRILERCQPCNGTGQIGRRRIHNSRIVRILDNNGSTVYDLYDASSIVEKEKKMATASKAPKAAKTPASEAPAVDLNSVTKDGELFIKNVAFDHASIKAEANVLISKDHKFFHTFNTYNGSLGKKGKIGKQFSIADEKAYERKLSQLQKQGYSKKG